jgi:tetratricopeptide (TPR) repeat protein
MVTVRPAELQWNERAHTHIARALALDGTNPTVHLWVGWSLAWCKEPEAGLPYLEQAVRARPTNAVARHGLGSALMMLNRDEEALAEWETAERLAPNSPNQYNLSAFMGYALLKQGKPEAALARFDHSISLLPTFFIARIGRALSLELLGRSETAIAEMRLSRTYDLTGTGAEALIARKVGIEAWWRNHPDLPRMIATMQKLWDATEPGA